jgi:hypothetical protein
MLSTMKRTVVGFHIPVFHFVIVKHATCDETLFGSSSLRCTVPFVSFAGWLLAPNAITIIHTFFHLFSDLGFPLSSTKIPLRHTRHGMEKLKGNVNRLQTFKPQKCIVMIQCVAVDHYCMALCASRLLASHVHVHFSSH